MGGLLLCLRAVSPNPDGKGVDEKTGTRIQATCLLAYIEAPITTHAKSHKDVW